MPLKGRQLDEDRFHLLYVDCVQTPVPPDERRAGLRFGARYRVSSGAAGLNASHARSSQATFRGAAAGVAAPETSVEFPAAQVLARMATLQPREPSDQRLTSYFSTVSDAPVRCLSGLGSNAFASVPAALSDASAVSPPWSFIVVEKLAFTRRVRVITENNWPP